MDIERILVIKTRALGDTLLATPALRALKKGRPRAVLAVLVSPEGRAVLDGNPDVDEVRVYDKRRGLRGFWECVRRLRAGRFNLAVALHASWRTALLARFSGAPERVVHNHSGKNYFSTLAIPFRKESKSAIQRDLDAIRTLGISPAGEQLVFRVDAREREKARVFWEHVQDHGFGRRLVLIPGAGKERKRWPAAGAAAFLDRFQERLSASWVVLAGPEDRALAADIQRQAGFHPPVFSGSLQEAGALLACSHGAVTTDSGPKHIAVAMGIPTLTLWTDEPEAEWHPYDRFVHALIRSATGVIADVSPEAVAAAALAHFSQVWNQE